MGDEIAKPEPVGQKISSDPLFPRIQQFFRQSGIFGQKISIEHQGQIYRISCDEQTFVIYQVNPQQGIPPGIPGWPVCIVNSEPSPEERHAPSLREDSFTCQMELDGWLEIIRQHCCQNPRA